MNYFNKIKHISLGGDTIVKEMLLEYELNFNFYPFDYVKSKIEGIIDCIDNNFINYFPEHIEQTKIEHTICYMGKNISFFQMIRSEVVTRVMLSGTFFWK